MHLLSSPTLDYHALSYCHHVRCLLIYQKLSFLSDLNRGGGIGGLTLAVALSRIQPSIDFINNVEVDIYEASSQITQIGTGITLWPRAWKILVEQLGLGPPLLDQLSGQEVPDDEPRKVVTRRISGYGVYSFHPGLAFQFRKSDQNNGAHIYDLIFAGKVLPTPSREFTNPESSITLNLKVLHFSSIER
jgi:salicylate hydroxylase